MSSESWRPKHVGCGCHAGPRIARIVTAEEDVRPMEWPQAGLVPARMKGAAAKEAPKEAPKEEPPDCSAQLAQFQRQAEQRIQEAHAAGVREGEATAKTRAAAEVQPVIEKLSHSIAEMAQFRGRMRKQVESDAVKLALAIAKRVLRRELAMDPDALRGLALSAFEKLQAQEITRVRTHPSQAQAITAILRQVAGHVQIEVLPDGSLTPGGIVFETNHGNLDASVESQLQEIERGLADHLRKQA
jgi:flagellar assembly protein FliH